MKTICLIAAMSAVLCVQAQDTHQWKAALTVTDDFGSPVSGANVSIFYDVPPQNASTDSGKIMGVTDNNGIFVASHIDKTFRLRFVVQKTGYYPTDIKDDFHGSFTPEHLNRELAIVLKKVRNPIPMYAKFDLNTRLPVMGTPIGYDLMVGDWVAPYGKGISTDIIFEKEYAEKAPNDYHSRITVSFPNKGDGIQVITVPDDEKGSNLKSPHQAPIDGYDPELTREIYAEPGKPSKFEFDENRIYLFRVRTVLDADGSIKSALYGKIYGDFMQFRYYLNPTPNDRNIEFDPRQNLLKGLDALQQVSAP